MNFVVEHVLQSSRSSIKSPGMNVLCSVLLMFLCASCVPPVESSEYDTQKIAANFFGDFKYYEPDCAAYSANANLTLDKLYSKKPVELGSGDDLFVVYGDIRKHMGPTTNTMPGATSTHYVANISCVPPGEKIYILFERNDESQNAVNSYITVPRPIELAEDIDGKTFSRKLPIAVSLNADIGAAIGADFGNDEVKWKVTGGCVQTAEQIVTTRSFEVPLEASPGKESETCSVVLQITRTVKGTVDPLFSEAKLTGDIYELYSVNSAP